jgi:hypothetical protein
MTHHLGGATAYRAALIRVAVTVALMLAGALVVAVGGHHATAPLHGVHTSPY